MCSETYGFAEELEIEARKARAMLELDGTIDMTEAARKKLRVDKRKKSFDKRAEKRKAASTPKREYSRARVSTTDPLTGYYGEKLRERLVQLRKSLPRAWAVDRVRQRLLREVDTLRKKARMPLGAAPSEVEFVESLVAHRPPRTSKKRGGVAKRARRALDREARLRGVEVA